MKFGIRVKVFHPNKNEYRWIWMQPSGGERYEFDSENAAWRMKEMCYPRADPDYVQVHEIGEDL